MSSSRRDRLIDMRPWFIAAALAVVWAAMMVYAESRSPDALMWTGQQVAGTDRYGVVAYSYDGKAFHQAMAAASAAPGPLPVTVDVDRSDPYNVFLDQAGNRIVDATIVLTPVAVAVLLVCVGLYRTRPRRAGAKDSTYGHGIDPSAMDHLLERRRRGI